MAKHGWKCRAQLASALQMSLELMTLSLNYKRYVKEWIILCLRSFCSMATVFLGCLHPTDYFHCGLVAVSELS